MYIGTPKIAGAQQQTLLAYRTQSRNTNWRLKYRVTYVSDVANNMSAVKLINKDVIRLYAVILLKKEGSTNHVLMN